MSKSQRIKNVRRKQPDAPKKIVLRYTKAHSFWPGIAAIAIAIALIPVFVFTIDYIGDLIFALLIFNFFFILVGCYHICLYYRWEIKIVGDDIYYCSFLGNKQLYRLEQIKYASVKRGYQQPPTMYIYSEEKSLFSFAIRSVSGYRDFVKLLIGRNIPTT